MGDMSFGSDAARFSGGFSRDYTVDSDSGVARGTPGSMYDARAGVSRYAYTDEDQNGHKGSNGTINEDEGGRYGSSVTPYRIRDNNSMGGRTGESTRSNYSAAPYPVSADRIMEGRNYSNSGSGMRAEPSYGRTGMVLGTSSEYNGGEWAHGKGFDHLVSKMGNFCVCW